MKLQLAIPTISQLAKTRPWFLFPVPLLRQTNFQIGKVRTLRGTDIVLYYITQLCLPVFHLRTQWRKTDAANWYIPSSIECFCARRSTFTLFGSIILGTLVYCVITRPSWIRLCVFLITPEWILGPIYLLLLFLLPTWIRLAHAFGHGSLRVIMQRLYGPGVWLAFTILTFFSCRVYDFVLDLLFMAFQVDLDGKRKLKKEGDSMLKERLEERRKLLKIAQEKESEGGRELKCSKEDETEIPPEISTKRKFKQSDDGDLPCVGRTKTKAILSTQSFSFKLEQKRMTNKPFRSRNCARHNEQLLDLKPWLTNIVNHISKASDVFILGYIYLTMLDCLLRLTRLNSSAGPSFDEETVYLRRCVAALYAGLGVSVLKGMDENQLGDALQGYKSPSRTMVYWVTAFVSAATLMYCETRISALGLSANASIIQVGLWKFLWPYEWIKRSTARIYFTMGLWTLVATYYSLQDISRRRLHFLRLWRHVPLPIMNLQTASTGTMQLLTWEFGLLLIVGVFVSLFLVVVSFLGWIRGFFDMFRIFTSGNAAELHFLGMEYEQLVFAASSLSVLFIKVADWALYKKVYNQYQGNMVEMVDFAFRHQTELDGSNAETVPFKDPQRRVEHPITQIPRSKR